MWGTRPFAGDVSRTLLELGNWYSEACQIAGHWEDISIRCVGSRKGELGQSRQA